MLFKSYKDDLVSLQKGDGITKFFRNIENYPLLKKVVENVLKPQGNVILKDVLNEAKDDYKLCPVLIMGETDSDVWQVQCVTEPFTEDMYRSLNMLGNNKFPAGSIIYVPKKAYYGEEVEDKVANTNGYKNIKDYYEFYKAIYNTADNNLNELCYYAISETTRIMLKNFVCETYGWQSDLYKRVGLKLKQEQRNRVIGHDVTFEEYIQRYDSVISTIDEYMEANPIQNNEDEFGL